MIVHAHLLQDCEICGCVAAELVRRAEQQHAAFVAADFQMAGDHEAVAGVVALAAEDGHWSVDAEPLEHVDAAAAGIFHEHDARDAELCRWRGDRARGIASRVSDWRCHVAIVALI